MGAKEITDQREYVVQYRKKGTKEWISSHAQTFPRQPSLRQIQNEMIATAQDFARFDSKKRSWVVKDDYEVRLILFEIIERTELIEKPQVFKASFLTEGVRKLDED